MIRESYSCAHQRHHECTYEQCPCPCHEEEREREEEEDDDA